MAKNKPRKTLNVSPETLRRLKKIQGRMLIENGEAPSLEELANKLIEGLTSEELEKKVLKSQIKFGIKFE
jgi:hypothetical protein